MFDVKHYKCLKNLQYIGSLKTRDVVSLLFLEMSWAQYNHSSGHHLWIW